MIGGIRAAWGLATTGLAFLGAKVAWDGANEATDGRAGELAQKAVNTAAKGVARMTSDDKSPEAQPATTAAATPAGASAPQGKQWYDDLAEGNFSGAAGKAFSKVVGGDDKDGGIFNTIAETFKNNKLLSIGGILAAIWGLFKFFGNNNEQKPSEGGMGMGTKLALGGAAIGGLLYLGNRFLDNAPQANPTPALDYDIS